MKKNLVLTGMMGVGKSTVAKKLSKKLKIKFVDIDQLIEKKENNSIKEIFNTKGENYFRKIEEKTTLEVLKKNNLIIALGGGAFVNSTIRRKIKNTSISFWLDLSLKFLLPRLNNVKKRPLINQDKMVDSINKIYSERKKIYNESDFKINCNSIEIDEVVKKIIKIYENS